MRKRKKKKKMFTPEIDPPRDFAEILKKACEGLWYMSETDAELFPFVGQKAEMVTKETLLEQIGKPEDSAVEERIFDEMFARLIKIQEWFGDEQKAIAEKFLVLKQLLETNLKDLKVFKVGKIQIDIYFVGLDETGILTGIQTKAVET